MTKKHFIALADAVRYAGLTDAQIEDIADFCRAQNPRFDYCRWVGYIKGENGPSGGKVKRAK